MKKFILSTMLAVTALCTAFFSACTCSCEGSKCEHAYKYGANATSHYQIPDCEKHVEDALPAEPHDFDGDKCKTCGYVKTFSEGLAFTVDEGKAVATLTGKGNFTGADVVLPAYHEGYPVEIGENAFKFKNITSVVIQGATTTVGAFAFKGCENLQTVALPDGIKTIGNGAFESCSALQTVTFGKNVESIEKASFAHCENLQSVTLPNTVKTLGDSAFANCQKLTSVTLSTALTTIGRAAFENCKALESLEVPAGVTIIEDSTFEGCTTITSIVYKGALTKIGTKAFNNCYKLSRFFVPASCVTIERYGFANCYQLNLYCEVSAPLEGWEEQYYYPAFKDVNWNSENPD